MYLSLMCLLLHFIIRTKQAISPLISIPFVVEFFIFVIIMCFNIISHSAYTQDSPQLQHYVIMEHVKMCPLSLMVMSS